MAIDDLIKGGLTATTPSAPSVGARSIPETKQPEEDVSTFKDIAMAIPRGVEGAIKNTYDLIDYLAMDALPDYEQRLLGRSQTTAGSFVEGAAQFLTGFIPVAGQLGKVGRIANLSKKLDKPIATALARGRSLNPKQLKQLSKQKDKVKTFAKGASAGAIADFAVFDAQEQRLSNLLQQYPTLANPVSKYLAADDKDGELEGRLKNTLEGLFIEAGVGGALNLARGVTNGVKLIKKRKTKLNEGKSKEEATEEALAETESFEQDILSAPEDVKITTPTKAVDEDILPETKPLDEEPIVKPLDDTEPTAKPLDKEKPKQGKELDDVKQAARKTIASKFAEESQKIGGEQAIKSAVKSITSSEEVAELAHVVANATIKEAKAGQGIPKTTVDELLKENEVDMDIFGDRGQARVASIKALGENAEALARVQSEQRAIKRIANVTGGELVSAAKHLREMKGREGEDTARVEMYRILDQFTEIQRIWGLYGRNLALPFRQRRAIYESSNVAPRDLGVGIKDKDGNVDVANLTKEQTRQFIDSTRGSMDERRLVDAIIKSDSADTLNDAINLKGLNQIAEGTKGRAGFDMANEWYMNSLLSGLTTQVVNLAGSAMTNFMRNVETAVGYTLSGNFKAAGAVVKYAYDMESIRESLRLMTQSFKVEEGITFKNRRVYDDRPVSGAIRAERFGVDPESNVGKGMDWAFKNIIRLPSRGLTAGDEFFKAMNYRTYVKTELHMDGMKKGLKGDALDEYVRKGHQDYLVSNRAAFSEEAVTREARQLARDNDLTFAEKDEFIENYVRENYYDKIADENNKFDKQIAEKGREWSLINTHTQDHGFMVDELNAIVRKIPMMSLVIPFVRTPMNILQFAWERTAVGGAKTYIDAARGKNQALKYYSQELYSQLDRATQRERAELLGKISMGASLSAAGLYYMLGTDDRISGFGPRNKAQREAWMMAGNQPYSMRVGDKNIQYSRLDPIATTLGIFADLRDVLYNRYGEADEEGVKRVFGAMALTFTNNMTNKSYVQGLDNLFNVLKDPMMYSEKLAGNIAGSFLMPNFINQMQNFEEDRILRETRGLMDYALKRTPVKSDKLPPKRNFLGEVVTMENEGGLAGFVNPLYAKNVSYDAVNNEIASLNHAFSRPQKKMGEIDLQDYTNAEGREAYDRLEELSGTVKIGNRTLRQTLNGLINSREYQLMATQEQAMENGVESPRAREISRVVGAYRTAAKAQMLREFPELRKELMGLKKARGLAKTGNQ